MARPVVTARTCADAIVARQGRELLVADSVESYVGAVDQLLLEPDQARQIGQAGRQRVLADYSWRAHLGALERHMARASEKDAA